VSFRRGLFTLGKFLLFPDNGVKVLEEVGSGQYPHTVLFHPDLPVAYRTDPE
jgi:hypothetical protein